MFIRYKTLLAVLVICSAIIGLKALAQKGPGPDQQAPTNLKILPNDISHDELIKTMKGFSMALGVHCTECHAAAASSTTDKPHLDFASDAKPEKTTARNMMRMVTTINHKYLGKMDNGMLEQINCVTCHNGHLKPMVNVDSLPKMPMH
jgi:hypothetical protein